MHFTTPAVVLALAGLAVATPHHAGRMHRRQGYGYGFVNSTTASSTAEDVSVVTQTVSPLPESNSGTGYAATPTYMPGTGMPAPTGANYTTSPGSMVIEPTGLNPSGVPTTVITDATLTYTLGSGSSTTVVTTTVKHTVVKTNYFTQYVTVPPGSGPEQTAQAEANSDSTTTTTSTSTYTQFITVYPVTTTVPDSGSDVSAAASGCPGPVTVTVTAAGVTTTVTETVAPTYASAASTSGSDVSPESTGSPDDSTESTSRMPVYYTAPYGNSTATVDAIGMTSSMAASIAPTSYGTSAEPTLPGTEVGTAQATPYPTAADTGFPEPTDLPEPSGYLYY